MLSSGIDFQVDVNMLVSCKLAIMYTCTVHTHANAHVNVLHVATTTKKLKGFKRKKYTKLSTQKRALLEKSMI